MTGRVQDGRVHHPQQIHGSARGSREAVKVIAQIYDFPNTRIRKEAVWASNLLIPAVQLAAGGIMLRPL